MTRIETVSDASASAPVRIAFRMARRMTDGRVPTSARAAAHKPTALFAVGTMETLGQRGMRTPGRIRELASLKAASTIGCAYCLDIGSWLARTGHGVAEEELREVHRHREAPCFDAADRAALDLAEAMSGDAEAAGADDELWGRLREHYTTTEIVELVHVVAWENYRARFNATLGITPDGFNDGAACALPARPAAPAPSAATSATA